MFSTNNINTPLFLSVFTKFSTKSTQLFLSPFSPPKAGGNVGTEAARKINWNWIFTGTGYGF